MSSCSLNRKRRSDSLARDVDPGCLLEASRRQRGSGHRKRVEPIGSTSLHERIRDTERQLSADKAVGSRI